MSNLSSFFGLDKIRTPLRLIRNNGGIINSLITTFRMDTLKSGKLVGEDELGNKYYENNSLFFGRNRWVVYNEKVFLNYDASQVTAEWYGWLHYKTDYLPHEDPGRPKYKWMAPYTPNLSGTNRRYIPYSTTKPTIQPWKPE